MKRIFTLFVALATACVAMAAECVIVPRPVSYEPQKGKVTLNSKSVVYVADKSLVRPATLFCSYVAAEKGLQLSVVENQPKVKGVIALSIDKSLAQEEYLLDVTKQGIVIKGGSEKGVFYGLQSLRQVVFHSKGNAKKVAVECMTVKDKPHFGYRGGMFDVCRHIFSVDEVKKFIDILALHKINRFHWHLTEDQGWRIEIKKYPNLTKIGSVRKATQVGRYSRRTQPVYDGKPYGGFFTQDEVRDIVRYASERYIDVIPEIDMPGHMIAALASYPELGCTKGPYEVRKMWGISQDILCAGRESTFEFIEGVLSEIVALFPSKYIHIGQKDNSNYCHCETCTALYEKYGSISAPTIIFTNSFADALDEEFPNFTFTFYAYGETERPPKDLTLRCNDNVVPVLCELHHACRNHTLGTCGAIDDNQIESEFLNLYGDNEDFIAQDHKDWTVIAERTYIYDYTINFLFSAQFFSNFETMQSTMKYMNDIGITGYVYNCGDGHYAAFNDLRNYLLPRLQWNVDADVEYMMMDFMNFYYGEEAAPYIKEIIDIQTGQIKATAHAFDFDWHYQSGYYTIPQISKLDRLWEKALNADVTEEQLFRIEKDQLSWEFFKANQFLGKYFFLNPMRLQAQEELYDNLMSHGITKVSSFSDLPTNKEDINFMQRPIMWK